MLRLILPATLALLLLPVASATHFCPAEGGEGLAYYSGHCVNGSLTPPLVYAAGCSSSLFLYANYAGAYTVDEADRVSSDLLRNVNHVVFGAPC